ncbi:MAG TPA: hypothetical protein VKV80_15925 [Streptosporangiaceae bacterium]|nr:hypothetical protein [Streptosporangiaceae bacterium]
MAPTTANRPHGRVISPVRRARHRLRAHVSGYPAVYLPFARHKYPGPSPEVISSQTELVIDGYTRSATTFAVYAFQLSQDRPVRLAHHLHAPAQLMTAARRGVPVLALIREPRGAVLSQLTQEPDVALRDALAAYSRFYARLLPYRESFVVGEFGEVTRDFGAVVRRLNARFGTSFAEFRHTEANMRECFDLIKLRGTSSKILFGFESGTVTWGQLRRALPALKHSPVPGGTEDWIPSGDRERAKAALGEQWQRPSLTRLRDRAEQVYQQFRYG